MARVRPVSQNAPSETTVQATPSAEACSKQDGSGCQVSGSGSSSQRMWVTRSPLSGTRTVKPMIPWRPGALPVASEARLIGVEEGTVAVIGVSVPMSPLWTASMVALACPAWWRRW